MLTSLQTNTTAATYMSKVFGWMFYAMLLSSFSALVVYSNTALQDLLFSSSNFIYLLMVLQIGSVLLLSFLINKINSFFAFFLFTFYSLLTGLTLSAILFTYDIKILTGAFLMTSGIYGIMCIIGFTTKMNLTSLRVFFMMSLFGIILASFVNLFLHSSGLDLLLSYGTIVLFSGLTAYDMQRIKKQSQFGYTENKYAIVDALSMYLNFINIFLRILRILNRD